MVAAEQVSQKLGGAAAGGFNWEEIGMDKKLGNNSLLFDGASISPNFSEQIRGIFEALQRFI